MSPSLFYFGRHEISAVYQLQRYFPPSMNESVNNNKT